MHANDNGKLQPAIPFKHATTIQALKKVPEYEHGDHIWKWIHMLKWLVSNKCMGMFICGLKIYSAEALCILSDKYKEKTSCWSQIIFILQCALSHHILY